MKLGAEPGLLKYRGSMTELKSNCQTTSIFCKDCSYLQPWLHGKVCTQFNKKLRSIIEGRVELPLKDMECVDHSMIKPVKGV